MNMNVEYVYQRLLNSSAAIAVLNPKKKSKKNRKKESSEKNINEDNQSFSATKRLNIRSWL